MMQGQTVVCDECNATIPPGGKYRQTCVEMNYQKITGLRIGVNKEIEMNGRETAHFDLCGDACLLKHISRLLNQGV